MKSMKKTLSVLVWIALVVSCARSEAAVDDDGDVNDNEIKPSTFDPCGKIMCGAGRECFVDPSSGDGTCVCVKECGIEIDPRRKVCSNHNETFPSDCELHRLRCQCEESDPKCPLKHAEKYKHVHIEYFGECREIGECSKDELEDFPRRMREWLFNVMEELADREALSLYYKDMKQKALSDHRKRWRNAAVWKWCTLDESPNDHLVSRHELFPVKAPLVSLEHCIGDFLDGCDSNDDHMISIKEWGKCLEIDEDEMVAECENIKNNLKNEKLI